MKDSVRLQKPHKGFWPQIVANSHTVLTTEYSKDSKINCFVMCINGSISLRSLLS